MEKVAKIPFALFAKQALEDRQLFQIKGGNGEAPPPDPGIVVTADTIDI